MPWVGSGEINAGTVECASEPSHKGTNSHLCNEAHLSKQGESKYKSKNAVNSATVGKSLCLSVPSLLFCGIRKPHSIVLSVKIIKPSKAF